MVRAAPNFTPSDPLHRRGFADSGAGRAGSGTYFFTLRLARRGDDALLRRISQLRLALRETLARKPFRIEAIAVLPDVIHTIWTLPEGDGNYSIRIGMWKARFSRHLPPAPDRSLRQIEKGEKGIWQKRFWEHRIRSGEDFARHRDLVHLSPVHAGLCAAPEAWPFSSYLRDRAHDADLEVLEEIRPKLSTNVKPISDQLHS